MWVLVGRLAQSTALRLEHRRKGSAREGVAEFYSARQGKGSREGKGSRYLFPCHGKDDVGVFPSSPESTLQEF
jgi:hypothetical protein